MNWRIIENMVTIICIAAIILGGLALGGGWWGLVGLVLLSNINTRT